VQNSDAPLVERELHVGGIFRAFPNAGIRQFAKIHDVLIDGENLEVSATHKIVQTWRLVMEAELAVEEFTRLSHEIDAIRNGVTRLTLTHDLNGAIRLAAVIAGEFESHDAGEGSNEVGGGLKTRLGTDAQPPIQSTPQKGCGPAL
jgi:hypothetical protein